MAPICNPAGEEATGEQTSTLAAKSSILERLIRALIAEKLVSPKQFAEAGLHLSFETSLSGRVTLSQPVYVDSEKSASAEPVLDPLHLLDELDKRAVLPGNTGWALVRKEIENSLNNLTHVLDAERFRSESICSRFQQKFNSAKPFSSLVQALTEDGYGKNVLAGFEQLVVDGHPLTPAGKVRTGMSSTDAARYGPEFGSKFGLRFVAVRKEFIEAEDGSCTNISNISRIEPIQSTGIEAFEHVLNTVYPKTVQDLRAELLGMGKQPNEFVFIPVHPHQLDNAIPKLHTEALSAKTIIPLQTSVPSYPLMSYRTFSVKGSDDKGLHIKTALEVQLTGAIRGISSASARNAPRMSRLLARIISGDLDLQRTDASGRELFIPERALAAVAFKESKRSLASILRDDIENGMADDETALPIAALFARSPLTKKAVLEDLVTELGVTPAAWLHALATVCITPCLIFLSRYGVSLEPHPQNTVIILRNGWPHRVHIRDFGGARILPSRLAKHGLSIDLDAATGLVITADSEREGAPILRAKLFYPLFGNHLGEVIATLAGSNGMLEAELWGVIRSVVRSTASYIGTKEALEDARVLLEEPWQRKCLLSMRLAGAVTDQRYVNGPNPLKISTEGLTASPNLPNKAEQAMFNYLLNNEPDICYLWHQELPGARKSIEGDVQASLEREGLQDGATAFQGILAEWTQLKLETEDSATNLALSRALVSYRGRELSQRARLHGDDLLSTLTSMHSTSDIALELDSLDAEGHPTHPCRKTKLRFSPADTLAYSAEAGAPISAKVVAVKRDYIVSSVSTPPVSQILQEHYPFVITASAAALRRQSKNPDEYELVIVHPFQAATVIPKIYQDEIASGIISILSEVSIACRATSSTRTLVTVAPGIQGKRLSFKTAIDVQITSSCRTISHESVRNGPYVSDLLTRLLSYEPRVSCIAERTSAAFLPAENYTDSRLRGLSMLLRDDVADYVQPGDIIIACSGLVTHSPLSGEPIVVELVRSLAKNSSLGAAVEDFMDCYADLLLSVTLPLLWKHGIALESHLQNTLLVLDKNRRPIRLLLRDFAGLRVNTNRLQESGEDLSQMPCPKAKTMLADDEETHCKLCHSIIFNNLLPVVNALSGIVSASSIWKLIRARTGKVYEEFMANLSAQDEKEKEYAEAHFEQLMKSRELPQKALVTMRVLAKGSGGKDYYAMQPNPLYEGEI